MQPIFINNVTLICNGEIYNYIKTKTNSIAKHKAHISYITSVPVR